MRPLRRTLVRALTAVSVGTLAATLVAGSAAALPTTTLTPHGLPRGADVSVPHLEGKTVVDGAVRIAIKAPTVRLLGKSGPAYVVATGNQQGARGRIFRVAADGTQTKLAKADVYQTILSGDGGRVVATKVGLQKSIVTAYDATTGALLASHSFKGYSSALDAQADQVLVSTPKQTLLWATGTGATSVASRHPGYFGDISSDVVATFTKDPYDNGCTVLSRITTGAKLWRSCLEAVVAVSTDGSRVATVGILSDGPGPGRVDARTITGQHLGHYQVRSGWFDSISFEGPAALLLEVNGARKAFTARCTGSTCERASDLTPAQTLRTS